VADADIGEGGAEVFEVIADFDEVGLTVEVFRPIAP